MKARVTKQFAGARDGEIYPKTFQPGDEIEGALAVVGVEQKWAEETKDAPAPEPKPKKAAKAGK